MSAEAELDRLYAGPPEDFTASRNALAKRLRADGERDEAGRIAKLRKPTRPAALANALSLERSEALTELFEVTDRLRKALSSDDGGDRVRALAREESDLVERLVGEAAELAEDVSGPVLDRVRETLQAAQVDAGVRERLEAGRLEREERAASIGPAGIAAAPRRASKARRESPARGKGKGTAGKRRLAAARNALESARGKVGDAKSAEQEAASECARVEDERTRVAKELERTEKELARAVRASERAAAKRAKAEVALDRAQAKVDELR